MTATTVESPGQAVSSKLRIAKPQPLGTTLGDYQHLFAAHCESGVTASFLRDAGLPVTEPMAFGVGGGLFFAHVPFVKVMGLPMTTFRSFPGTLFRGACKRLGVEPAIESFRRADAGMRRLDQLLEQGQRVGLQVNIFWLNYVPRQIRIHFNAHNLMVLEKRGDQYVVSDPIMEDLYECSAVSLRRARFSGGAGFWGKGKLYYPRHVPQSLDLRPAVLSGLRHVCHRMTRIPRVIPWFGLQGIDCLARQIARWPRTLPEDKAREYMAGIVRMQEEIGTGGAGFRYLFAAFLQQSAEALDWPELQAMAERSTAVGDHWRNWALHASRMARGKPDWGWPEIAEGLRAVADDERAFFEALDRVRVGGKLLQDEAPGSSNV